MSTGAIARLTRWPCRAAVIVDALRCGSSRRTYLPRLRVAAHRASASPPCTGTSLPSSRGRACAAPSRWPPRSPSRRRSTRAATFPQRDLIIFLTYAVILATLVLQGLTLPMLIRVLGVEDDGNAEQRESKARLLAAQAALDRIEELRELGLGARRDRRPHARHVRLPHPALLGALRRRGRRRHRGAVPGLPAPAAQGARGRARRDHPPAQRGRDRRRHHAPHRARPRPRGHAPGGVTQSGARAPASRAQVFSV